MRNPVKSPLLNIFILKNGSYIDVSDYIDGTTVSRELDKNSEVTFDIKPERAIEFLDGWGELMAKTVQVQYGYIGGRLSPIKEFTITLANVSYASLISVGITASDKGISLKKYTSGKVWVNMTISDIVIEIAKKHGLTYSVDKTFKVYDSLAQGQETDYGFVKYLARLLKGDYQAYVTGTELYFKKRDLAKSSIITYSYGDYEVISFEPVWDEQGTSSGANGVAFVGFDKENLTANVGKADNNESTDSILGNSVAFMFNGAEKLADKALGSSGVSNYLGKDVANTLASSNKIVGSGESNPEALKGQSDTLVKDAKLKLLKGDLVVQGNPLIDLGDIITIAGVAKIHLGNWTVTAIQDSIGSGGYITTITLAKNSFNSNNSNTKAIKNNSIGTGEDKKAVKVVTFDLNGKQLL
jgi:hypothetical protein